MFGAHAFRGTAGAHDFDVVGIHQPRAAEQQLDAVALVVAVARAHLLRDDGVGGAQQVGEFDLDLVDRVLEQGIAAVVRQHLDVVAQRLAGDGPPMRAAPAHLAVSLDDGDPLPGLGELHGRTLAGGPGADDDGIEGFYGHGRCGGRVGFGKRLGYTTPTVRPSVAAVATPERRLRMRHWLLVGRARCGSFLTGF